MKIKMHFSINSGFHSAELPQTMTDHLYSALDLEQKKKKKKISLYPFKAIVHWECNIDWLLQCFKHPLQDFGRVPPHSAEFH